jgi:hypothetical protein
MIGALRAGASFRTCAHPHGFLRPPEIIGAAGGHALALHLRMADYADDKPYNPWAAHADETTAGSGVSSVHGLSAGAGVLHDESGNLQSDLFDGNFNVGGWTDTGGTHYGLHGDAQVVHEAVPFNGPVPYIGTEFDLLRASGDASVGSDTAALGVSANVVDGAVTLGSQKNNLRLGASIGLGLGGRLHYGDADKNGIPELGVGADVGPFSFDVKSEWLGRLFDWITN